VQVFRNQTEILAGSSKVEKSVRNPTNRGEKYVVAELNLGRF